MSSRPTVSIGLPVRNGAKCLAETIRGIQSQSFEDFELLVEDDASTDETERLCRDLVSSDARILYQRSELARGFPATANRLIDRAQGRFFKLCSQDEPLRPEFLGRCVAEFQSSPSSVVLVYPRRELIGPDGRSLGVYEDRLDLRMASPALRLALLAWRLRMNNLVHGLIRRETLLETRRFLSEAGFESVLLGELALRGEFREVSEVLYGRRMRGPASAPAGFAPSRKRWFHGLRLARSQLSAIRAAPLSRTRRLVAAALYLSAYAAARARDLAWRGAAPVRALARRLRSRVGRILRRWGLTG